MDDDVILSPGWCPLCGEPQTICDSYGDCARAFEGTVSYDEIVTEVTEGKGSDEES